MSKYKTLVIHPDDESTKFLRIIYEGKDFDVITDKDYERGKINDLIEAEAYDRLIMLGHGLPHGLLAGGGCRLLIDGDNVEALRRTSSIYIWCNADIFVQRYHLSGFCTGMFISEIAESQLFNVNATQAEIVFSNNLFSQAIRANLHLPPSEMKAEVLKFYRGNNPVIAYNVSQMTDQFEEKQNVMNENFRSGINSFNYLETV